MCDNELDNQEEVKKFNYSKELNSNRASKKKITNTSLKTDANAKSDKPAKIN